MQRAFCPPRSAARLPLPTTLLPKSNECNKAGMYNPPGSASIFIGKNLQRLIKKKIKTVLLFSLSAFHPPIFDKSLCPDPGLLRPHRTPTYNSSPKCQ